jgi:DNA polymerase (family 10)
VSAASTVIRALRILADLSEIRGADVEAADLRRVANAFSRLSSDAAADIVGRAGRDGLQGYPGIPHAAPQLIRAFVAGGGMTGGTWQAGLPSLYSRLLGDGAIEPAEASTLVRQRGILTLSELQTALDEGSIGELGPHGLESRLRQAARALERDRALVPLGRARDLLDMLAGEMLATARIDLATPAGDVRRFEPLVSGLIIVARAGDPRLALDAICALRSVEEVRHRAGGRALLCLHQAEVDVRVAAPDEHGTVLFHATGSPAHVRAIRERHGGAALSAREEDVYGLAELPFIAPELRQDTGELEAAANGRLPSLITEVHVRGDLHMHTVYSDGADTLDAMVAACARLGYDYIAITDHSERAAASRTVSRSDLSRQRDEIDAIRERYPAMAILHGIEVDIMPDGSLDFPDRILESLDIVLASLHDSARHDAKKLTRRCIQAIRHPLVTVITHPANRLVGRREGYRLDFEAVFAAAAETGTALEVDGAPSHLDLDGEHARAAVAAGVTLTIDSDCHRARLLRRQLELGIGTARRGWVEPHHVLNTRPLHEVLAFIEAKRARG